MSEKFVIETMSGSLYKLEDVSHLFGSDRWCIHRDKKRYAIVWIGQVRTGKGIIAKLQETLEQSNEHIGVFEGKIGDLIEENKCINASIFYTEESHFDSIIKWISHVHDPDQWPRIKPFISHTSTIIHVYMER
jgi:hypothetical protein